MPNRILRDGILTSERIDQLSVDAELFYRRLMSVVDDFGRYTAHLQLLRASCFPLRLDTVKEPDIDAWLSECATARLLTIYTTGGKRYLEMADFRQRTRAKHSKWPSCDGHVTVIRRSHAHGDGDGDGDGDEGVCGDGKPHPTLDLPEIVTEILEARQDWRLRPEDVLAEWKGADKEVREQNASQFIRDCCNMVSPPSNPIKMLRGYLSARKPGRGSGKESTWALTQKLERLQNKVDRNWSDDTWRKSEECKRARAEIKRIKKELEG